MKAFSVKELKAELSTLTREELMEKCIRLAKYKKENKELLAYLLFSSADEATYIKDVETGIDEQFDEINRSNMYLTKKMLRKILKNTNRYIKYSGTKQTEVELRIYFCRKLKDSGIDFRSNVGISTLYLRQIFKIKDALDLLHEDLQHDYSEELKLLI